VELRLCQAIVQGQWAFVVCFVGFGVMVFVWDVLGSLLLAVVRNGLLTHGDHGREVHDVGNLV